MGFLRPTTEQAQAQAAAFIGIDPRMDNVDRYLTRSIDQCSDMREKGLTGAALTAKGHARFEGGSMPDLTDAQVEQINAAISVWCTPVAGTTDAPATATDEASVVTPSDLDLEKLAAKFGCGGYTVQSPAPLTLTYATCTLAGSQVQLYAFASPDMSAAFLASVEGYGITADQMVAGDGYLIAPTDPEQVTVIRTALQ